MARCLLGAGFAVVTCAHRRREALERLKSAGALEGADPAEVAGMSSVLITCVPDSPQVEEALFGARGAALGARAGTLFIDMSTISPVSSKVFSERLRSLGHSFVDAPVSGGAARAREGTLTIMVGSAAEDFERALPLLSAMGTAHHLGGVGMGETVKLVNQVIISTVMLANVEALSFAIAAGADLEGVRKVISSATGSNYLLETWLPKTWFAGTFEGGFAMDLLRKDLAAALDTARSMKVSMPASALAYQLYTHQSAEGDGGRDYSAIAKFYERIT